MAQLSVAVRNAQLTSMVSTIGASPTLTIRSGAMPANCAAGRTGTLIVSMTLPSTYFAAPSGGAAAQSGTWSGTVATQALAGYFSIDQGGTVHAQGLVGGVPWVTSFFYAVGATAVNGGNAYVVTTAGNSAASGGPSGTGTGIVDGTVVWNFLGALPAGEITLDNVFPGAGSTLSLQSVTLTGLGA